MSHALQGLAVLAGRDWLSAPLSGGLTNTTMRVWDATDPSFDVAVRLPPAQGWPESHRCEVVNHRRAAAAGLAPGVLYDGPDCLAVAMVPGAPLHNGGLDNGALNDPTALVRVGQLLRDLHQVGEFEGRLDVFDARRVYAEQAQRAGLTIRADDDRIVEVIRAELEADPETLASCHNDLVAANIIDDGDRLWLIDFEFSAMAEPSFDLGNLWIQSGGDLAALEVLVAAYDGGANPTRVRRAALWGVVAGLTWPLWAAAGELESGSASAPWAATLNDRAVRFAAVLMGQPGVLE